MKLYIAGPMTGLPHHNVAAFDAVADVLRAAGYEAVSPPDITRANPQPGVRSDGSIDPVSYATLVRLDLIALLDCAAVVVLPGWSRSRGCTLELAVAQAIGLPVYAAADFVRLPFGSAPMDTTVLLSFGLGASLADHPAAPPFVAPSRDDDGGAE